MTIEDILERVSNGEPLRFVPNWLSGMPGDPLHRRLFLGRDELGDEEELDVIMCRQLVEGEEDEDTQCVPFELVD